MGPEGGEKGGYIIAEGTPEEIMRSEKSSTGQFLAHVLAGKEAKQPAEVIAELAEQAV